MAGSFHLDKRQSADNLIFNPTSSSEAVKDLTGPRFIDTGACLCALRTDTGDEAAFRCIGNRNKNVYKGTSGEWYKLKTTPPSVAVDNFSVREGFFKPDNSTVYLLSKNGFIQEPKDAVQKKLVSPFDFACTAINDTLFSSHYYKALDQVAAGKTPTAAATCLTGSIPITIQNATSWEKIGCYKGFDCTNNTINALPQYCTPVQPCLHARLGGATCGAIPMGQFEPIVCPAGFFCPNGGRLRDCPQGHFCPKGTSDPIKCSIGSLCPKSSAREQTIIPVIFLILMDLALVGSLIFLWIRRRKEERSKKGKVAPSAFSKAMQRLPHHTSTGGYAQIEEPNNDIALESRVQFGPRRAPTGFLASLDDFDPYAATAYDARGKVEAVDDGNTDLREFVASLSKCIEGATFGLNFEFTDLGFWPKKLPKPILSNITGEIARGSLVGVLGGSGAGKSTFVNVLMGKQSGITGSVKVNGIKGKLSDYKKIIGYVPQDDIVLPELTVRENILHSARVRLPSHWKESDIQHHVDVLIECLQLSHVKDSLVGSPAKPVVSGGQRKRVSIGMELAAAPMALLLDEPTSGLDATAASHIMKILTALAHLGITVVMIIHQPREEIFHAIDDLILLANGRMIYQGKERDAQGYFERAGFVFPEHANPADILMDIITGEGRQYKKAGDTSKEALIDYWSNMSSNRESVSQKQHFSSPEESSAFRRSIRRRGAYFHRQLWFCISRSMLQQYRLMSAFWFEIGLSTLAGLLIGLALNSNSGELFHGLYHDDYVMLSSALDYLTLSITALLVAIGLGLTAAAPGVKVFGEEKLIYRREAASGHNKFAYYLGKIISTFPRMFFGCFHFTTFFMLLATPLISWPKAFIVNLLYYYAIYGLASCVSMITRREDGPLLATMASLIVGILSGFAPTLVQVAKWNALFIWRSSPGTWISEAYYSENILPLAYLYQIDDATEQIGVVLDRFGFDLLLLFAIGSIYRVIAFFLLILVRRSKQK